MYWVYMLECADGSLYTGWTKEIGKRLAQHNAGKGSKYVRSRLPRVWYILSQYQKARPCAAVYAEKANPCRSCLSLSGKQGRRTSSAA